MISSACVLLFSDALLYRKSSCMLTPASWPVTANESTHGEGPQVHLNDLYLGKVCPNIVGEYTLVIISGLFSCDHMDEIKKFSEEETL